jgi:predicted secreted protein
MELKRGRRRLVMKRLVLALALAIVLALALAVPAFAANPVLTFGYEPVGAVPWSAPVEGGKLAQSFTAEVGGRLAAADIYLTTQSFDTGSLYAELYDIAEIYGSTSVPTGDPLAVSTSVAANGPPGFTTFSFSGSDFILEEGHQYALVLREEVFSQAAGWGDSVETGDPAYSGNMSVDTGSGWSPADGYDFYFRVHVGEAVNEAPAITSDPSCTFTVGTEGTFDITYRYASGTVCSGDLPSGVIFRDWGDNVAMFNGTPDPGTGGVYNVTLTTSNGVNPDATQDSQDFTLTVNEAPAITSSNGATFTAGVSNSFTFTTFGYPKPAILYTGGLPSGVSLVDNGNGTATLNGTPGPGTAGVCPITITATDNGVGSDATQNFTLTVQTAPVITTQPTDQTVIFGQTATFTVAADGNPAPTVRWQLSTDRGKHWSDIRGATSLSYTTAPTTPGMSGYLYRAVLRNSAGSVTSDAAGLTVNPIPFKVLVDPLQWTGPSHGKYQATVSLSITDTSGNPMAANKVKITGVWKSAGGRVLGTSSGTTDDHGVLRLSARELSAQPATFMVTSATKTGYSWQK